jgi:hypothetical protein
MLPSDAGAATGAATTASPAVGAALACRWASKALKKSSVILPAVAVERVPEPAGTLAWALAAIVVLVTVYFVLR